MREMNIVSFLTAGLLLLGIGDVFAKDPTVMSVMEKLDEYMFINTDISAEIKLTTQEAGQGITVYESYYYRRDSDDSFLIVMTAPANEAGNGYLRVGDNFWMYRQNTRTFQHINRDENIAGTDMQGGDFERKKLTELYEPTDGELRETNIGGIDLYVFDIIAVEDDVTYPEQTYYVRQDNYLPMITKSYSLSGTLMQTAYFLKYSIVDGNYICIKQRVDDEFEEGNKTLMEIINISLDDVDDDKFTKAYLENLSK